MAATVGAAVKSIGNQILEEAKYLYGVEEKVEELHDELKWMTCFLRDIDSNRDRDERMREWVYQIMWLAYQAEDIIENFILKVEWHRRGGGHILNKLKRYSCFVREAMALHEAGSDIDSLLQKISRLTSRLQTYGVKITRGDIGSTVKRELQLRRSYAHVVQDENSIVGLDGDVTHVVGLLLNGDSRTVALCGMGGLGKTTLAKQVYRHKDVRQHFNAFAWAYISEQCHTKHVLVELLRGLTSEKVSYDRTEEDLMENLSDVQQQKKCLIVLDDIWNYNAWDSLKEAFPIDPKKSLGGKLLLTTRNESVAEYVDKEPLIHRQGLLGDEQSLLLLNTKLGRDISNIFGDEDGKVIHELKTKMLKRCRGLPMAIITLGGVLATKKSLDEWKTVHDNINSILSMADDNGLSYVEVLNLSYYDLPVYLKPCFLYLGTFPEDAEISARKLIQLWMAEGFISTNTSSFDDDDDYGNDNKVRVSMEAVGEGYLTELVDRSIVQVSSIRKNGKIKTCRVHDLLRDVCLSMAAEENFLKLVAGGRQYSTTSSCLTSTVNTRRLRYRRLSIHDELGWQKIAVPSPQKEINNVHVKSLLIHHGAKEPCLERKVVTLFKMLRVLDLKGSVMTALPEEIGGLVHLRYLSIRDSEIKVVPSSIGNLRCLQTLDLESSFIEWFPDVIWRMKQLRHLYLPTKYRVLLDSNRYYKPKLPRQGLTNLEILSNYHEFHRLKDIARLTNLRVISDRSFGFMMGTEELRHIEGFKSRRLEYVSIKIKGNASTELGALKNFQHLNTLKLRIDGRVLPRMLPQNVTSLFCVCTYFETDAMQVLEKLTNLRSLTLDTHSYRGETMKCSQGGFPKLTYLSLSELENLTAWTIERGAMPSLRTVFIRGCTEMRTIPDGLEYIGSLQKLNIFGMLKSFGDGAREWKVDVERGEGSEARQVEKPYSDKSIHRPIIHIKQELSQEGRKMISKNDIRSVPKKK